MSANTEESVEKTGSTNSCISAESEPNAGTDKKELTTKEAYFASLQEWAKQTAITQNALAMFPYYLLVNYYPQLLQSQMNAGTAFPYTQTAAATSAALPNQNQPMPVNLQAPFLQPELGAIPIVLPPTGWRVRFHRFRLLDEQQQQALVQRIGGYEYVLAPFWKRVLAEAIDIVILFITKIIVTFAIVNFFDLDMGFEINKDVMRKTIDDDDFISSFFDVSLDFINLSSDLLFIELLTKLVVCMYEAFWTVWYNGATPGKTLMKIKIQYVEALLPLQAPAVQQFLLQPQREPVRAIIYPGETPTLARAFLRALAKNLVMTLLFPICIIMVFFKNNRTVYDILTRTVVVEDNSNPVYRQPQAIRQLRQQRQ